MPKIQLNLPEDVNERLEVYSIKSKIKNKRESIIAILREFFKKRKD